MLVYFLRGSLPWQGLSCATKEEKYKKIYECKKSTVVEELCADMPKELCAYLKYCRSLGYEEVPNYKSLKLLFQDLWVTRGYDREEKLFDWDVLEARNKLLATPESSDVQTSREVILSSAPEDAEAVFNEELSKAAEDSAELPAVSVDPSIAKPTSFKRKEKK